MLPRIVHLFERERENRKKWDVHREKEREREREREKGRKRERERNREREMEVSHKTPTISFSDYLSVEDELADISLGWSVKGNNTRGCWNANTANLCFEDVSPHLNSPSLYASIRK
ncbi:hypothetical protein FHG87_014151 [Trinorchestia longiramus]|nr:hypothetical protein FHG87_014151 [Trinorchestia longiramus]